jgi:hypothetical protein
VTFLVFYVVSFVLLSYNSIQLSYLELHLENCFGDTLKCDSSKLKEHLDEAKGLALQEMKDQTDRK